MITQKLTRRQKRTLTKNQMKLYKLGTKVFYDILKASKKIAKAWDTSGVSPNVLLELIGIAKNNIQTMAVPEGNTLKEDYNKLLDSLYNICVKKSKEMNSKTIPIVYLEACIIQIDKSFKKGLSEEPK